MNRIVYAILLPIVIALGLVSRTHGLPPWVHLYVGDVLWAVMFYLIARLIIVKRPAYAAFFFACMVTLCIECTQLIQWPVLQNIRATRVGGLLLGHGFLVSDVIACLLGAVCAFGLDLLILRRHKQSMTSS